MKKKHSLTRHIVNNRFWFITAFEIYSLAIYFVIQHNYFYEFPPVHTILYYLDDPVAVFLLACAGTLILAYAIWDFHWFYSLPIVTGLSMFIFGLYFGGFLTLDIDRGSVGIGTVLTGAVIIRVVFESFASGGE